MSDEKIFNCLVASKATFLTCAEQLAFLKRLEEGEGKNYSMKDFRALSKRALRSKWNSSEIFSSAQEEFDLIQKGYFGFLPIVSSDYPSLLKEIYDPPFALFFRGSLEALKRAKAAVVGTRVPTSKAAKAAWELGYDLGSKNFSVVSGLALGIDSFAHAGNHAAKVGSVAVLGCGIDQIYPVANKGLASELIELGGAIISEYPIRTPPATFRFPMRNRIVSALTNLTVVVQAPLKSGALITADFALEQGREVVVLAAGIGGKFGLGCEELAKNGAFVIKKRDQIFELISNYDYTNIEGSENGVKKDTNNC